METVEIRQVVQRIWDTTAREGAWVRVDKDKADDAMEFVGNRSGLLRLAAELLSAAIYEGANPAYLFLNIEARISVSELQRPEPPPPMPTWKENLAKVGCLLIGIFLLVCTVTGLFVVIKALFP